MPRNRLATYDTMFRVRKMEEDAKARDAARAQLERERGEQLRQSLEQTRRSALDEAAVALSAPEIDASGARAYFQYERHLARAIDMQDAENQRLERELTQRRADLHAAAVRRRVMERLVERERLRRLREAAREERKLADEAAIVRALLAARKDETT
jgi:flagellar export protein FliJ